MKELMSYLMIFVLAGLLQGSSCNPGVPTGIDNDCNKSLSHLLDLSCAPKGKWLSACEAHHKNNNGMFDLHCINQATDKNTLINQCKVACEELDAGRD